MRVKFILPALTEARGRFWRPVKYSLFPPLGLATLAGYLDAGDEAVIIDEHVEPLELNDAPDLVAIEAYITSARRSYEIADFYRKAGSYVVMGGLHVTSIPDEALLHADSVVLGPAEEAWPRFLSDFREGRASRVYRSSERTLAGLPEIRRDLIKKRNYLVPNSIVVSRGCPHSCDFCYKDNFFRDGKSFYTYTVDQALAEIGALKGRHLFFLDDNIFGDRKFASELFSGMRGMKRIWQGAATVRSILDGDLLDRAVASGLRSLFIGFESLDQAGMLMHGKNHNRVEEYQKAINALHSRGVMINASFVFGLDSDTAGVFDSTVDWAVANGLETATFHILTPYPGTGVFNRYSGEGRMLHRDWDLYDTRHVVFRHASMSRETIEAGYRRAYAKFYAWKNICRSAASKDDLFDKIRHFVYTGCWKKFDPAWGLIVNMKRLNMAIPPLEHILEGKGH